LKPEVKTVAKLLFINPIVRQETTPRHVPFGMAMLAAIAMREGHLVQIFDHNAWRKPDSVLKDVMEADDWDIVASGGITTAYNSLKTIFRYASEYAPNAVKLAGGGMLTSMPHDLMRFIPEIDVGIIGEAYLTLPEFLGAVDSGAGSYEDISGLIVRNGDGSTKLTKMRALLHDLDSLPFPAWELFPLEEVYFPNSSVVLAEEAMTATRRLDINGSYGCSLICRYCFHLGISGDMSYPEGSDATADPEFDTPGSYDRAIRYHSPQYIVDMVKYAVERFNINFVSFLDENLMTMDQFSKRTWMDEICDRWHEAGLVPTRNADGTNSGGVTWGGTSHATLATERILKRMAEAGCCYLDYGWESFSPQILKSIGKGATPDNNKRSYEWTMKAGIRPIPNQMIGFPQEDFESIRASMHAWEELGIVARPFFVTPYPGCEWYTTYKERLLEQYDGNLELYVSQLGDATDLTGNICENFNDVELYGIRELMIRGDMNKLDQFEAQWREVHGDPESGVQRARDIGKGDTPTKLAAE
jgi:anaerobic magnesium-protoporphyrin IX monomethyl ester cyclase